MENKGLIFFSPAGSQKSVLNILNYHRHSRSYLTVDGLYESNDHTQEYVQFVHIFAIKELISTIKGIHLSVGQQINFVSSL